MRSRLPANRQRVERENRGRAMNFYLVGDHAAEIVARDTPRWDAWFQERFPMPTALDESE